VAAQQLNRFSCIRANHEVVVTPELEAFYSKVIDITADEFGFKDATMVRAKATNDAEFTGRQATYRALGVFAVRVYPPQSWRTTVFEHTLPSNARANSSLQRLLDRLVKVDLERAVAAREVTTPIRLHAPASRLQESTLPAYARAGREIAMVLESGAASHFFKAEHDILYENANTRRGSTGRQYNISAEAGPRPDYVPILRLPPQASELAIFETIERIEAELEKDPPFFVEFDELGWDSKLR
jgi:hypothetical protein